MYLEKGSYMLTTLKFDILDSKLAPLHTGEAVGSIPTVATNIAG